jgi:MFS family permease
MELPKQQQSFAFSRTSLSWFYYFYGFIYGSWVSMIPTIVNYLGLSTVELGMILLLGGIGAMLGIPIVSSLILSGGSARSILSGVFALSCMLPIAGFPWFGIVGLSFGVLGVGIGSAMYDVSNNSHAVTLEKLLGQNIIGSLQAINSFGNLCGVLCGGICGALHIPTFVFFAIVGAAGSSISMLFYQFLVDAETESGLVPLQTDKEQGEDKDEEKCEEQSVEMIRSSSTVLEECSSSSSSPRRINSENSSERMQWLVQGVLVHSVSCHAKSFDDVIPPERRPLSIDRRDRYHATSGKYVERSVNEPEYCGWDSRLIGLCFMGFMNFLGVGSVNNWSTIYFSGTLDTSPFFTTLGYAFFQLFVMIGQISSDFFVMRFGPKNVLVFSGIMAFVGISTVVYAPSNPFLSPRLTCAVSDSCTVVGIVGYSITGMGFSSIGPILISQTVRSRSCMLSCTNSLSFKIHDFFLYSYRAS